MKIHFRQFFEYFEYFSDSGFEMQNVEVFAEGYSYGKIPAEQFKTAIEIMIKDWLEDKELKEGLHEVIGIVDVKNNIHDDYSLMFDTILIQLCQEFKRS